MLQRDLLESFGRAFVGRRDDYAVQRETGRYVRAGQLLTLDTLYQHLAGKVTIGTYVIDEHGLCRFAVFDSDALTGLADLAEVQRDLANDGVVSHLERSRRGGHLWVLLEKQVTPDALRAWLLPYCPAGVEFYPKQDKATGAGYGSLIRVPLGIHRMSGSRYPFVAVDGTDEAWPVASSLTPMLVYLSQVERAAVPASASTQLAHTRPASSEHTPSLALPAHESTWQSTHYTSIAEWVAGQDAVAIISRYVRVDRAGLGHCPFGEHHGDGYDSHPSFRVYPPLYRGASSWFCYTWGRGGNVFDFLCRYHNLDARAMWLRIQERDIW